MVDVTTIKELVENSHRITGEGLDELLDGILSNESAEEQEKAWAEQIHEDYWVNNGELLPIPTAFYSLWVNKKGAIRIRRDIELSPRVADFMNPETLGIDTDVYAESDEYVEGDLRAVIALKLSMKGQQLVEFCQGIVDGSVEVHSYEEYQKQLAQALLDKYFTGDKKPKDNYYYKVQVRQVGVPNVVRDVDRSPRPVKSTEE